MTTLVLFGAREINGRLFHHGDELPPGLLPREVIDQWLDRKWLLEYDNTERRSLCRLFPAFSGCKEQEQLTKAELRQYALSP
jgi:hypothetical protein